MNYDLITFNGVDGSSGDYLLPAMSPGDIASIAQGGHIDPTHLNELKWKYSQAAEGHYGLCEGIDPRNLADAGWGVIFASDANPAIREALDELLIHRRKQATQKSESLYKEYIGTWAYRPGESKTDFLKRHGACGIRTARSRREGL